MKTRIAALAWVMLAAGAATPAAAQGEIGACPANETSAVQANITGLKDRSGQVMVELYPDAPGDFLKDDRDLIAQGKVFRRVIVKTPPSGDVVLCLKAPRPGRYTLLFTHSRGGKMKFNFMSDGAGVPSNHRMGRAAPKPADAVIDIGRGVTVTNIRAQYLRGLGGFGPIND